MATLRLITEQYFQDSVYGQMADQVEGDLTDIIAAAEAHIEQLLGRLVKSATYTEVIDPIGDTLFLPQYPVTAVTQVRRRSGGSASWETVSLSDIRVNTKAGYVSTFSTSKGTFKDYEAEVTYTAGYADVPEDLKTAVVKQTVLFAYQDLEVYGAGDGKPPGHVRYFNDDIERIVRTHKRKGTV